MDPTITAIVAMLAMLILMLLGMPIGFAMLITGFAGFAMVTSLSAAYSILSTEIWLNFASYSLSVIPMFVFMGQIVYRSGTTKNLYDAAYKWVGSIKGGIACTTILASTAFAAICGSNTATTATMGTIALPEMKRYGYDQSISAGSVAAGGTLGVVIPPSVVLLIIGLQTEQSIGKLFVGSIIPGLLLSFLFMFTVVLICYKNDNFGPAGPKTKLLEKIKSLPSVIDILILFTVVIGGLYRGWFTPTEAGAAGAFGAIVICLLRRKLSWKMFSLAVIDTIKTASMVLILLVGAVIFGRFLSITRLPFVLADWAASLPVPGFVIIIAIIGIYIIGGALMDALGFLAVSLPIFFPVAMALGYNPVWFTVLITIVTTMGAITPPVGVNAYIVNGLSPEIKMDTVFKGVSYFLVAYFICILLLFLFPFLVLC